MARLLVLDLDGTLVDSARDIANALDAALAHLAPDAAPLGLERVLEFVGDGARVLIERALAYRSLALPVDEVLAAYLDCYRERLLDTTGLYPGIAEALDTVAARGAFLAVLTNKPGDMSRAILSGLGAAGRFARIVGAGDGSPRKPNPAGLLALLQELRAEPAVTWMVGDSETDVLTARAAGVRVAGAAWGFHPQALRAARPDRVLERPAEIVDLAAD